MNVFLKVSFVSVTCVLAGCHIWTIPDPSYEYKSTSLYDGAHLIESATFDGPQLYHLFREFVDTECGGRTLARLTVSANRWDLAAGYNISFPEMEAADAIKGGLLPLNFGKPQVAQVWCFGGQATAIVRLKSTMIRRQLAGTHDAREVTVQGVKLTLVGINLSPGWSPPKHPSLDTVWLYARTANLPEVRVAEAIHDELEGTIGTGTFLIIRTEPFFVENDGPAWDIFDESLPEGSAVRLLNKPHIVCAPKATNAGCLFETSPTNLPVGEWRKSVQRAN